MPRTTSPLMALAIAATLALAGCSTGGGDDAVSSTTSGDGTTETTDGGTTDTTEDGATTTTEVPEPDDDLVPVDEWAEGYCSVARTWRTGIDDLGSLDKSGTLPERKDKYVAFLGDFADLTTTFADGVEELGVPDADDAEDQHPDFIDAFDQLDALIAEAIDRGNDLPVDDPVAFESSGAEAIAIFQDELSDAGQAVDRSDLLTNPELAPLIRDCDI